MRVDQTPSILDEAHDALRRVRPRKDADPLEWMAFHRHNATVYSSTAEIDSRHRYEALQCVGLEIRKAREIEHRLDPEGDDE